jgi:hypothetical protein
LLGSVDYELIPQTGIGLDGFVWSAHALATEALAEVMLQPAGAETPIALQVVLLGYDQRAGRYRYGVRISEPSRLPPKTVSREPASGPP